MRERRHLPFSTVVGRVSAVPSPSARLAGRACQSAQSNSNLLLWGVSSSSYDAAQRARNVPPRLALLLSVPVLPALSLSLSLSLPLSLFSLRHTHTFLSTPFPPVV
jgi:hypothetical protein